AGRQADATAIARKAPKQAELLSLLQRAGRLGFESLEERAPGWKRLMKSLGEKGWVEVIETQGEVYPDANPGNAEAGPALNPEQAAAFSAISGRTGFGV